MGMATAITAFSQRGARRGHAFGFLVYSGILTAAVLALAAWIAPLARADDLDRLKHGFLVALPTPEWTTLGLAGVFSGLLLALAGFVVAPAMVASAVAQERRAGTLDQLRMTPLSSLQLALGFIVGVPARLYLLCAGPLAVHVLATLAGPSPLWLLGGSLGLLAVGTATSCALGLCVALAPRQESGGALAALVVAAVLGILGFTTGALAVCSSSAPFAMWHPAGGLSALLQSEPTLWWRISGGSSSRDFEATVAWVPIGSLLASLSLGALLLRAACRKLSAPQLPLLSKPQALLMFALGVVVLTTPVLAGQGRFDAGSAAVLTFHLMLLVTLLGLQATPTFEAWAIARRRGRRPGWLAEDAAPHVVMWLMEAAWAAVLVSRFGASWARYGTPVTIGWAVLTVLTLPIYVLFAGTRYSSPAARGAFVVAIGVHLVSQLVGISAYANDAHHQLALVFVGLTGMTALLVPAWVLWRQRAMARALVSN